jgi:hypothetical protein
VESVGGFFFFGCCFRETERGLKIVEEPVNLGAGTGWPACGVSGVVSGGGGGGAELLSPPSMSLEESAASSLLNPGIAPVFRLTPLPNPPPIACPVRLGAGNRALNPLNAPPRPLTRARFAGGPSAIDSPSCSTALGRLTSILRGFERSTTFLKAGFEDADGVVVGIGADAVARSESEFSESE